MDTQDTRMFAPGELGQLGVRETLKVVCQALEEKGYRPVDQIVGYLVSGDPAYITSHNNARLLIQRLERDELLEEIVSLYLKKLQSDA